ncbi:hypothetical protein AC249_AIPGENE19271 [Exaiptasia diaphana]|nr:hypothetical protein AC249_AIPGENE19271 [Exaiptasia diaphana]
MKRLSDDIRWKVIYHELIYGSSIKETCRALFVGKTFVCKIRQLYKRTGNVAVHTHAVISILRNPDSLADWGTYTSNAVVTGNHNARNKVESEHYDQIREFFSTETDALIISATMTHFGIDDKDASPKKNCIPSYLRKIYIYPKCRKNHEKQKHGLVVGESEEGTEKVKQDNKKEKKKEDHIYNYGCLHIALGLLLRDVEDAVKEVDGQRLVRVWKFLTYIFRLKGHSKYALAGLRLIASIEGLLTPKQAHKLIWNRFAGTKQGKGKRISRDLRVEQLNKIAKEEIRALGFPNINDESVVKATRITAPLEKMIKQSKCDLGIKSKSGHHCNKQSSKDFFGDLRASLFERKSLKIPTWMIIHCLPRLPERTISRFVSCKAPKMDKETQKKMAFTEPTSV